MYVYTVLQMFDDLIKFPNKDGKRLLHSIDGNKAMGLWWSRKLVA